MELLELVRVVERAEPLAVVVSPAEARRIRERAGLSRERAAAAIGVSAVTLVRWEKGAHTPSLFGARQYRRLLGYLYDLAGEPRPQSA